MGFRRRRGSGRSAARVRRRSAGSGSRIRATPSSGNDSSASSPDLCLSGDLGSTRARRLASRSSDDERADERSGLGRGRARERPLVREPGHDRARRPRLHDRSTSTSARSTRCSVWPTSCRPTARSRSTSRSGCRRRRRRSSPSSGVRVRRAGRPGARRRGRLAEPQRDGLLVRVQRSGLHRRRRRGRLRLSFDGYPSTVKLAEDRELPTRAVRRTTRRWAAPSSRSGTWLTRRRA